MHDMRWCGDKIAAAAAASAPFDVVFKLRPDLAFPEPIAPHCRWNLNVRCQARDWFQMLPGSNGAAALAKGWEAYETCDKMYWKERMILETWNGNGIGKVLTAAQKGEKPKLAVMHPNARPLSMLVVRTGTTIAPSTKGTMRNDACL